jgi:hypothetical protein
MKESDKKELSEYRIKYNAGEIRSVLDSYHYYTSYTAEEALGFHDKMMNRHGFTGQTISVERKNRFSNKWEDESTILNEN